MKKIEAEFGSNNKKLLALGIHEEQNYFEAINAIIEEALYTLQQKEPGEEPLVIQISTHEKIKENVESSKINNSNETMAQRKFKRKIDRLLKLIDEAHEEINNNKIAELGITKTLMEENFQEIKQDYTNLSNIIGDDEKEEEEYEIITHEYKIAMKQVVVALETKEIKPMVNSIKLEDIKIPVFFGNVAEWPSFHDLFKNLVHNHHNFSNAEKMYRLKNYIRGEAGRLIQHLRVTDANYEAAWNILKSRYENKRLLFTTQVDRILDHPMVNTESALSVKQLLDTTNECVQALKGLNVEIDDAKPFIARIIVRKLDRDGLRLYEQSIQSVIINIWSFELLSEFSPTSGKRL